MPQTFCLPKRIILNKPDNEPEAQRHPLFFLRPTSSSPVVASGAYFSPVCKKKFTKPRLPVRIIEGSAMPIQRHVPEVSDEEIHKLLREIEGQSLPPASDVRIKRPRSYSGESVRHELSLDEILKKVQRDIEQA